MADIFVFVGRANRQKSNGLFPRLALRLGAAGHDTVSFEPARIVESERINARLAQGRPRLAAATGPGHPLALRIARALAKAALLLAGPQRMGFIDAALTSPMRANARELRRFVARLPAGRVHLIGHSAGCIIATMAADSPRVCSVTASGYPFRHPLHPPEPWRTRHLPGVKRPLLLIQGRRDIYGGDPEAYGPLLPGQAQIITPDDDHELFGMNDDEFETVWTAFAQMVWP